MNRSKVFREFSHEKLLEQLDSGTTPDQRTLAVEELQRRYLGNIADETGKLIQATDRVHQEVAILTKSSERLEKLTKTLRNLTWVLIFLTVLAAVVPIGIETWKAYHENLPAPIVVQILPKP
jgi:hypothetical protein